MRNQPQQTPGDPEAVKNNRVMVVRIMQGAFIAGLVVFAIIAAVVGAGAEAEADGAADQQAFPAEMFWIVIGALAVVAIAGAAILPGIFAKQAGATAAKTDSQTEADNAIGMAWSNLQVVRMSLLEGAGLFAAVATLISGNLLFLLPAAVFIAALVMVAPSRAKLDAFESLAKNGPPHPTAM
ncbi:MAG: hypothetical protein JJU33_12810 [Phycisphaerales bacterium]|nr:hypothetical protein [Phycisphaerales bacterium]